MIQEKKKKLETFENIQETRGYFVQPDKDEEVTAINSWVHSVLQKAVYRGTVKQDDNVSGVV